MSKNKRTELEIIDQILSLATEETKKTHLLYQVNLSYDLCNRYLDFLLNKGFLRVKFDNPSGNGKIYYTTGKGKKFLNGIKNVLYLVK